MNIRQFLFSLLIALPFVEIYLLMVMAGLFGFLATLAWIIMAASAGMALIRDQGPSALLRAQSAIRQGESPAKEVLDSGLIALGGLLLIIPGILSDMAAFLCLIPATRQRIADHILNHGLAEFTGSSQRETTATIEGEYRRED